MQLNDTQTNVLLKKLAPFKKALGNTSLIEIRYPGHAPILAKLEYENPTGTIKDRPAYFMVRDLITTLPPSQTRGVHLMDYSGGSMARSLAHLGRLLNWQIHIATGSFCPSALQKELEDLGAKIYMAPGDGFWGVMEHAQTLSAMHRNWHFLNQTYNKSNYLSHFEGTGREILRQAPQKHLAAWIASVGSGGTFSGVFDRLKTVFPDLRGYVVTPREQPFGDPLPPNNHPKYQGSGGLGSSRKQPFIEQRERRITAFQTCSYDEAMSEAKTFYETFGIMIGSSAAANLKTARKVARTTPQDQYVVTVFASLANDPEKCLIREKLPAS